MAIPSGSSPSSLEQMSPMSPLALESPSPSASSEPPKVLHTPIAVSTSALKDLYQLYVSNTITKRKLRPSAAKPPNGTPPIEEPSSSSTSTSIGFGGWRLPGLSVLTRTRSTAN